MYIVFFVFTLRMINILNPVAQCTSPPSFQLCLGTNQLPNKCTIFMPYQPHCTRYCMSSDFTFFHANCFELTVVLIVLYFLLPIGPPIFHFHFPKSRSYRTFPGLSHLVFFFLSCFNYQILSLIKPICLWQLHEWCWSLWGFVHQHVL